LCSHPPLAPFFEGWQEPWHFADDVTTAQRLEAAGFVEIETDLEDANAPLADAATFDEFVRTAVFRTHLERLPPELHAALVEPLVFQARNDSPPFCLDYRRLNIRARRPGSRRI
jgi:hypothetical protein